jgi:hypothetical protein
VAVAGVAVATLLVAVAMPRGDRVTTPDAVSLVE